METGELKIYRMDQQAGDPGRASAAAPVPRPSAGRVFAQRRTVFCSIEVSANWMQPTHIMEGNLLHSKSTDLNVNFIQKHSHRNIQNKV